MGLPVGLLEPGWEEMTSVQNQTERISKVPKMEKQAAVITNKRPETLPKLPGFLSKKNWVGAGSLILVLLFYVPLSKVLTPWVMPGPQVTLTLSDQLVTNSGPARPH